MKALDCLCYRHSVHICAISFEMLRRIFVFTFDAWSRSQLGCLEYNGCFDHMGHNIDFSGGSAVSSQSSVVRHGSTMSKLCKPSPAPEFSSKHPPEPSIVFPLAVHRHP